MVGYKKGKGKWCFASQESSLHDQLREVFLVLRWWPDAQTRCRNGSYRQKMRVSSFRDMLVGCVSSSGPQASMSASLIQRPTICIYITFSNRISWLICKGISFIKLFLFYFINHQFQNLFSYRLTTNDHWH